MAALIPVRHFFGIDSFGVNVFVARAAGDAIVPDHTETGEDSAGHEELYYVVEGKITFVVEGEEFDAAAGTVVVCDPDVRRSAIAKAAGATVLAVGGLRGKRFEPSRWEQKWTEGRVPRLGDSVSLDR